MAAAPDADLRDARRFDVDALHDSLAAGMFEGIGDDAPPVRALLILLESVSWHVSVGQIARALPHFPESFGIEEMRNVMARLGFSSTLAPLDARGLDAVDLPAVMMAPSGACHVLLEGPAGPIVISALDGTETAFRPVPGAQLATFFATPDEAPTKSWTATVLRRMRPQMAQLAAASFAINLMPIMVSLGVMAVFDLVIPTGAIDTLVAIIIGLGVALALEIGFRREKARLLAQMTGRLEYLIGSSIYNKILSLPVDMITTSTVGQQVARLKQFESIPQAIAGPVATLALELPFALLFIAFAFALTGALALAPLALILFYAALGAVAVPVIRRRNRAAQQARALHHQLTLDTVSNLRHIKAMGIETAWRKRLTRTARANAKAKRKAAFAQRALMTISTAATPMAGGATVILGAYLVMQGELSQGALIAAMIIVWRIIAPLQSAFMTLTRLSDLKQMIRQVDHLMSLEGEGRGADALLQHEVKGKLEFLRASFRYRDGIELAIRNADLAIPAGAWVALTGPSGAGKTTLMRLALGLYRPQTGAVLMDGRNIRQIPTFDLRGAVAYVPHVTTLVHGTIAQNLRLAKCDARDDELAQICAEMGLAGAIARLPDGMATRLDAQAQTLLPSGFKRSVAVAQALLTRPKVLLLDDPARSLDPELESAMIAALEARRGATTIVMITHRPSHARLADYEIVMEEGRVARFGPVKKAEGA